MSRLFTFLCLSLLFNLAQAQLPTPEYKKGQAISEWDNRQLQSRRQSDIQDRCSQYRNGNSRDTLSDC